MNYYPKYLYQGTINLLFLFISFVSSYTLLKQGSSGTNVKNIQLRLLELGYSCGPEGASGNYDRGTTFAVYAFQQVNNIGKTGIADKNTQTLLFNKYAKKNNVNGEETLAVFKANITTLSQGDIGSLVERTQVRLSLLGYDCGKIDGYFGNKTVTCVQAFQQKNKLPVLKSLDETTYKKLFYRQAIPNFPENLPLPNEDIIHFVNIALGEYSYKPLYPKGNNFSKFGAWYGTNPAPWCCIFVSWVANENQSVSKHLLLEEASVDAVKESYIKAGRFVPKGDYRPEYGDLIFFKYLLGHIGIVVGTDDKYVYTIEGNSHNQARTVKRMVSYRNFPLNYPSIMGYGRNYSGHPGYAMPLKN
ncbi:hypothetical protein H8356DRAFT_129311 [Neocallimastix lanati (nom. inval.)]|jgi:peptidoglycan hydrolase-like protein with peptidoglycan-binding domain|nr:hypothetical protein H8356DRAFT_129311 [Neocallimastix sp. JGI-2020a]